MSQLIKVLLIILALMIIIIFTLHREALKKNYISSDSNHYVTSEKCLDCHQTHFEAWNDTMHPKMFKLVTDPNEILGDFEQQTSIINFKKSDVEFIIGSKWEQVYARKIDGEYYPFTAKWLVTTQKWIPYKVDNWRETPLSIKCNGCHTTGFNPQNYEFSEFGIGCEACHGPGYNHVQNKIKKYKKQCTICHDNKKNFQPHQNNNKTSNEAIQPIKTEQESSLTIQPKDIIVSYKSAVCGQCHSRGSQAIDNEHMKIKFNFPIDYIPGNDISPQFKPLTQSQDKKGKFWWGNGISKNRHQEYADFSRSKHAMSLKNLKEKQRKNCGAPKSNCLQCHSTDYRMADKNNKPSLAEAKEGITCIACHEPHGIDKKYIKDSVGAHKCEECHTKTLSLSTAKKGKEHFPCPMDQVQCADCHMPKIVLTGGDFSLRSHAFKIIPPEATEKYQMPNSCQNGGCHEDKSLQWAKEAFHDYYPDYNKKLPPASSLNLNNSIKQ